MSCYFRHISDILEEAGITVTKANRKQVDQLVHHVLGITYKNCPVTWQRIKQDIRDNAEERRALIAQLRSAML